MRKSNNKLTIIMLCLLIPLSGVGIDVYVPSLPAISHVFDVPDKYAQYSVSVYLFGFALAQLILGPLSDTYGRKKILLLGLLIFNLGCFMSLFSFGMGMFLISRFIQGVGVTAPVVIAKAVVTDRFVGEQLKVVSTYLVTAWSVGPIVAPAIGGFLQHYYGWHAGFYFLVTLASLLMVLVILFFQETNDNPVQLKLFKIFMSYKEILKNIDFILCILCMSMTYSFITIFNVLGPFLIQKVYHQSALAYGHIALLLGVACFMGSLFNRYVVMRLSQLVIVSFGTSLLITLSLLTLMLSYVSNSLFVLLLPVFMIMFVVGFLFPNFSSYTLGRFVTMAGVASAIIGVVNIAGNVITTSLVGVTDSKSVQELAIFYVSISVITLMLYLTVRLAPFAKRRIND